MEKSPNQVTILVIDEKRAEREKLEHELHVVDFRFRSIACDGTLDALSHCLAQNPAIDVVLCPFSLPGVNALQMLQTAVRPITSSWAHQKWRKIFTGTTLW